MTQRNSSVNLDVQIKRLLKGDHETEWVFFRKIPRDHNYLLELVPELIFCSMKILFLRLAILSYMLDINETDCMVHLL